MTMLEPWMMLVVSLIIFGVGLFGLLVRKNLLVMLMCVESAVGLGLVIALFRTLKTVDSDQIQILRD